MFEKFYVVDYQPTCENLVMDMAEKIRTRLPAHVSLFSLRLVETATSYAEWFAADNICPCHSITPVNICFLRAF